jgi:hypothetical protein
VDGRGAGIVRLSPAQDAGGAMKAWLFSTTLQSLDGHEEMTGANRPTGAAYSRNFGGDNWAGCRSYGSVRGARSNARLPRFTAKCRSQPGSIEHGCAQSEAQQSEESPERN